MIVQMKENGIILLGFNWTDDWTSDWEDMET